MGKPIKKGPDYSDDREFAGILEDLRGQFKTFGEGLEDVRHRLNRMEEQTSRIPEIEMNVNTIKTAFRPFAEQVSEHESRLADHHKRLTALEQVR